MVFACIQQHVSTMYAAFCLSCERVSKYDYSSSPYRSIQVDGKTIKAQIWDTAGQERYRAITSA